MKRIETIDAAKGISIILVAFAHSELAALATSTNDMLALFRMPLFFFLSGIFLSISRDPTYFIISKTDALLKPYFITMCTVITIAAIKNQAPLTSLILGVFYGTGDSISWTPLWFLTHLWTVFISSYFLLKQKDWASSSVYTKVTLIAVLLVIGSSILGYFHHHPIKVPMLGQQLLGLPFSLDIIPISTSFFISGYFLKNVVCSFKPSYLLSTLSALAFLLINFFYEPKVDLNKRIYQALIPSTLCAASGIYLALTLAYFLVKFRPAKKVLTLIGSSSLFILIFHQYIGIKSYDLLTSSLGLSNWATATIALAISVSAPILIKLIALQLWFTRALYIPTDQKHLHKFAYKLSAIFSRRNPEGCSPK
jgi:fucose 4-O-acetylase-like acetyltransferase